MPRGTTSTQHGTWNSITVGPTSRYYRTIFSPSLFISLFLYFHFCLHFSSSLSLSLSLSLFWPVHLQTASSRMYSIICHGAHDKEQRGTTRKGIKFLCVNFNCPFGNKREMSTDETEGFLKKKKKAGKRMNTRRERYKLSIPRPIFSSTIFFLRCLSFSLPRRICVFCFFLLPPSTPFSPSLSLVFFVVVLFHSLIYRVDNSSLSDIQWQVRNARKNGVEVVYYETGVDQPVFTFDDQERKGREREKERGGEKSEKWFFQYRRMIAYTGPRAREIYLIPPRVRSLNK